MNITPPGSSSFIIHRSSFRERGAEPGLVVAALLFGGGGRGDEAVGGGGARAELDGDGAQLVAAEDGERELLAGALLRDALVEEGERGAVAVHGDDLVGGREALLVGGRPRGRGAAAGVARGVESQADPRERRVVVQLLAAADVAAEELFEARARGALGRALKVLRRVVAVLLEEVRV